MKVFVLMYDDLADLEPDVFYTLELAIVYAKFDSRDQCGEFIKDGTRYYPENDTYSYVIHEREVRT